jgi:hypothetical protein
MSVSSANSGLSELSRQFQPAVLGGNGIASGLDRVREDARGPSVQPQPSRVVARPEETAVPDFEQAVRPTEDGFDSRSSFTAPNGDRFAAASTVRQEPGGVSVNTTIAGPGGNVVDLTASVGRGGEGIAVSGQVTRRDGSSQELPATEGARFFQRGTVLDFAA